MKIRIVSFVVVALFYCYNPIGAQNFGPELLQHNDFGTIESEGINTTTPLHIVSGGTPPDSTYYQPPTQAYFNNRTVGSVDPAPQNISINPYVTVAPKLDNNQTSYIFGFNEGWYSNYYTFLNKRNSSGAYPNSAVQIPMAPNNGYYVIATSTGGMYSSPTLGWGQNVWYTVYDRYETNPADPSHYFLIVNADPVPTKVFYKQKIAVTPGHIYRMSADIANLSSDTPPNVGFHIVTTDAGSTTIDITESNLTFSTGAIANDGGQWHTYTFDYTAPCDAEYLWIAFTNNVSGGGGNDLGLDNLSLKELKPQIAASAVQENCNELLVEMTGGIADAFNPGEYDYNWYNVNDPATSIGTGTTITITQPGIYYLYINKNGFACGVESDRITIIEDPSNLGCLTIPLPHAYNNTVQVVSGVEVSQNILANDCNRQDIAPGPECSQLYLKVLQYTIPAMYSPTHTDTTYVAGTPVIITDDQGHTIGLLKIMEDGTLTFQAVPDYTGTYTDVVFPYTIVSTESGGISTADVTIARTEISYTAEASCAGYPVTTTFVFPSFNSNDYLDNRTGAPISDDNPTGVDSVAYRFYLVNTNTEQIISDREIDELGASFDIKRSGAADNPYGGDTAVVTIVFDETQAGILNYELRKKEPYLEAADVDDVLRELTV